MIENLQNEGKHCWNECSQKQGDCEYCGSGLCCRKSYEFKTNGCDGTIGGDDAHVCVAKPENDPKGIDITKFPIPSDQKLMSTFFPTAS